MDSHNPPGSAINNTHQREWTSKLRLKPNIKGGGGVTFDSIQGQ